MIAHQDTRGLAIVCDADGIVREVIEDRLGVFGDNPSGRPLSAFLDPGSVDKGFTLFERLRTSGAAFDWELDLKAGEGDPATVRVGAAAFEDRVILAATPVDGDLMALIQELAGLSNEYVNVLRSLLKIETRSKALSQDLHTLAMVNNEMAAFQRELAKKNAQLIRLDEEKNRLLGMVAHDLRGPLNAISLASQVLDQSSERFEDRDRRMLTAIRDSTALMADLVNNALDLAAIESGRLRLALETADLAQLTERTVEVYSLAARQKEINVAVELAERPLVGRVDASKFQQVVGNLVSNALKHSPRGTNVRVSLRREDSTGLLVVSDDGPGIAEEQRERLFRPFEGGTAGTEGERSSGLGLAIAQKIVEGHGGVVEVDSAVGRGSTFRVRWPLGSVSPDGSGLAVPLAGN